MTAAVDPICQEFEAAWQRGDQPSVEQFVAIDLEPKLSSKVVEIAERYAKNTPAWKRVVGAALFRDAQFERAIQEFTDASKHFKSGAWDNFFMAMAYARTGRADLARQAFDTGLAELAIPNKKVPWFSRIEEEALRNEAERVLREPQRDLNE